MRNKSGMSEEQAPGQLFITLVKGSRRSPNSNDLEEKMLTAVPGEYNIILYLEDGVGKTA